MPPIDEYSPVPLVPQVAEEAGMPQALRTPPGSGSLGSPDALAALTALQALTAERTASRLRTRVAEILGTMVNATKVALAVWDEDASDWVVHADEEARESSESDDTAAVQLVPMSAVREAQAAGQPLVVHDAVADERFAHDPYFRGIERCSLMLVPIVHQDKPRAVLAIENRASAGAFARAPIDALMLIAGQLAISLDGAQVYERLERKVREQGQQLHEAQMRLLEEARRAGMARVATNVLHNVGNVLTSVNVSAHVLASQVRQSPAARVGDLAQLLSDQAGDLEAFFAPGGRGRLLPAYLRELADALGTEREQLLSELTYLCGSVDHIKNVVTMQQTYAGSARLLQPASMDEIVEDALRMQEAAMSRHLVQVQRDYAPVDITALDKTRVMQILVNLLENARQAMDHLVGERRMNIAIRQESGWIIVSVRDCGCGIAAENLERIFSHGFTTKVDGHGFGLHSCAIAAQEMGGSLQARSDGPGMGATFELRLPAQAAL